MAEKFENLKVWQLSHKLALEIYKETSKFPEEEKYGLISQLRRAATSVAANIVEGSCRKSDREFSHFLSIALGSCSEVIYHLILAKDLSILDELSYNNLRKRCEEVSKMLNGLLKSLK